jgi:hypothetical protein
VLTALSRNSSVIKIAAPDTATRAQLFKRMAPRRGAARVIRVVVRFIDVASRERT